MVAFTRLRKEFTSVVGLVSPTFLPTDEECARSVTLFEVLANDKAKFPNIEYTKILFNDDFTLNPPHHGEDINEWMNSRNNNILPTIDNFEDRESNPAYLR